jgi:exonuclease VII large subunit
VLARGYTVVRDSDGTLVRDAATARTKGKLAIGFHDGEVAVTTGAKPVQTSLFE